jgi:cytoskeletal protein CcmA (bactofilin family)
MSIFEALQNKLKFLSNFFGIFSNKSSNPVSIIQEDVSINGSISSQGAIYLFGKVFGNIECKEIFIDHQAIVDGVVNAQNIMGDQFRRPTA